MNDISNSPLKTVLVTGCCGMIGFATTQLLLKKNYQVIGVDCFKTFDFSHHFYQKYCLEILKKSNKFKFYNYDVSKSNLLELNPDFIIHLAAFAGVKFSFENPEWVLQNNQQGMISCLELAKVKNIPLLFASSSSVYGDQSNTTTENEELNPLSVYALTKKHNEDIAKIYHDLYGVSSIGLRFFTVYGPYSRGDMLVHKIYESIDKKVPLTLHNMGTMKRSFTFNKDIAHILLKFIEQSFDKNKIFDIYNLGNNTNISLLNFISLFENFMEKKANIILSLSKPIYEPDITNCDNSKILNKFSDLQFTSFEEGVKKTVQWYKKYYQN